MERKLIYGVGTNDADYVTQKTRYLEGERTPSGIKKRELIWQCPYYHKWSDMLRRCYSLVELKRRPSYRDCTVCEAWLTFSNFKSWMETQDYEGRQLDKDILVDGNKVYSENTCVFIPKLVNCFLTEGGASRGKYSLGVHIHKATGRFRARLSNPFNGKLESLGLFDTDLEAHLAWKKRKHELACHLADSEYITDEKVAVALRNRYINRD